ncbi:DUF3727 domain-containing protein [Microseira sp. BLCC-F43]|jgi:hypothetical protein|uniref:DUF3727 domain-containing protein n=1 Tax=Microseira sp. BLCC-F43 TaxID=3153602 RepID=UPI0035B9D86C
MSTAKENGYSQDETVILKDETGRELTCYVEQSLEAEAKEYVLLRPVDDTVEIFSWQADQEEEAFLVEEEEVLDEIFPIAQAVLAEQDLTLKRSAFALTVAGDVPPPTEEDILTLEIDDEAALAPLEPEQLQFLANFYHEDHEYEVFRRLDPLLLFARRNNAGQLELLSPEEFQRVQPMLEEQLAQLEDEMDEYEE